MFCTFLAHFLIEKSFLTIQSTSWITVVSIIISGYENCCYKPQLFMDSLFGILFYWIISYVFIDCVLVYDLNLSLLTHKGSRRHLGKWIKTSPSQYSLNKIPMKMCSESGSRKELGHEHCNCWEKDKWAAENWLESRTVEETCSLGVRGIQSRDKQDNRCPLCSLQWNLGVKSEKKKSQKTT